MKNIRLNLNDLGEEEDRAKVRQSLTEYFSKEKSKLCKDCQWRLEKNVLRVFDCKVHDCQPVINKAPWEDFFPLSDRFKALGAKLEAEGIPYHVNRRLVRGLDYYNATVFEWVTTRLGAQGTVCAGGRYDSLIEQIGGKPAPACGYAMGVERLLALMQEGGYEPPALPVDAYLVHAGDAASKLAPQLAERLRDAGLSVVLHCGGGSFKSQMKKADASGANLAIIIGDDEAAAGEASIKPLRGAGEQKRVSLSNLPEVLSA